MTKLNLCDTIGMMQGDNYKMRFLAEYSQLRIRLIKLKQMLASWDSGTLDFEPTCPREIYGRQVAAMEEYLDILEERSKIENIRLGMFDIVRDMDKEEGVKRS